jgi:hypothetical protein
MHSNALDQLLLAVTDPCSISVTLATAEPVALCRARRVTENDWRLTLEGSCALAGRLEEAVQAAPGAAQGAFRTVESVGSNQVRLEIGCRGTHLVSSLLEIFIDDYASTHPHAYLSAMLQVDDARRPRRIDVLAPVGASTPGGMLANMLEGMQTLSA